MQNVNKDNIKSYLKSMSKHIHVFKSCRDTYEEFFFKILK